MKLLPKSVNNPKGFTLIELMVVIAIIAILAVIGVTVFSGAQGSARDGKRRSEISSTAKSIEAAKDYEKNLYKYTTADGQKDFPTARAGSPGVPTDPTTGNVYCVRTSNSSTAQIAAPTGVGVPWTTTCPTNWTALDTSLSTTTANNLGATTPDVKAFTVCASLERNSTPFCSFSLTQ